MDKPAREEAREGGLLLMIDFDGVLVDSYHMLPRVFRTLVETIPGLREAGATEDKLLLMEEMMDFLGTLDRFSVYKTAFGLDDVTAGLTVEKYWSLRVRYTQLLEPGGLMGVESKVSELGGSVWIVCSQDDTVERKRHRVKEALGAHALDTLIIYGPDSDTTTLAEAIETLLEEKEPDVFAYIDDKSTNLNRLQHLEKEGLILFKRDFRPPFPRASAWTLPLSVNAQVVSSVGEAIDIIKEMVGSTA